MPPIKVWVRVAAMYNEEDHQGEYQQATLLTAKSLPGFAVMFQVLLDNGVLRDKLTVADIRHTNPLDPLEQAPHLLEPIYPLDYLQLWNSFSYNITFMEINYLAGLRCDVYMKDKTWCKGTIVGTFDWSGETASQADLSLCEHPDEHKSGHLIELDSGQYAIQPNNRIRIYESSFVTKPFPERPDYKVCKNFHNVEQADKWVTEDSDKYMYDINKREEHDREKSNEEKSIKENIKESRFIDRYKQHIGKGSKAQNNS